MSWETEREKLKRVVADSAQYTAAFRVALFHALARLDAAEDTIAMIRQVTSESCADFAPLQNVLNDYDRRVAE